MDAITNLLPRAPLLPPDWRWRVAQHHHARGTQRIGRPWRRDAGAGRAYRFLRALERCRDDAAHLRLAQREPDLFGAHAIYAGTSLAQHELRARVLAGETPQQIADRLATNLDVIEAFESLFFDVRPRLQARSYIVHAVLGPALHTGFGPRDFRILWPWFGFVGGSLALDAVIEMTGGAQQPQQLGELSAFFKADAEAGLARSIAVAIRTLPTTARTQTRLLQLCREVFDGTPSGRQHRSAALGIGNGAGLDGAITTASNPVEHDSVVQKTAQPAAIVSPAGPQGDPTAGPVPCSAPADSRLAGADGRSGGRERGVAAEAA